MKQLILAATLSFSTLFSTASMANETDTAYMFGNQDVNISYISTTEMANTEGQLFGMTKVQLLTTSVNAVNLFRPIIQGYLEGGKRDAVLSLLALWTSFQRG